VKRTSSTSPALEYRGTKIARFFFFVERICDERGRIECLPPVIERRIEEVSVKWVRLSTVTFPLPLLVFRRGVERIVESSSPSFLPFPFFLPPPLLRCAYCSQPSFFLHRSPEKKSTSETASLFSSSRHQETRQEESTGVFSRLTRQTYFPNQKEISITPTRRPPPCA